MHSASFFPRFTRFSPLLYREVASHRTRAKILLAMEALFVRFGRL
jgi:hypothetical protein